MQHNSFFADDGFLTANSVEEDQDLLDICSEWSLQVVGESPLLLKKCGSIYKNLIITALSLSLSLYGVCLWRL